MLLKDEDEQESDGHDRPHLLSFYLTLAAPSPSRIKRKTLFNFFVLLRTPRNGIVVIWQKLTATGLAERIM
jgi:hypothetical protein